MDLYGQGAETNLLRAFMARLPIRSMVDVGAERGAFAAEIIGGSDAVHVIEPEPANVAALRERFAADGRVTVHPVAAAQCDGVLTLRLSSTPTGEPITFGHTILHRADSDEIAWRDNVVVPARSVASLVAS